MPQDPKARAILAAAVLTLAACASTPELVLYHPTKTPAERETDTLECDLRATEATAAIRGGIEAGFRANEIRDKCMVARGYRWVPRRVE